MRADPGLRQRSATQLLQMHPGKRRVPLSDGPTSADQLAEGGRWIPDYYRYLDTALGRVMARFADGGGTLIICSDHGFRVGQQPVPMFADHRDPAVLIGCGKHVRAGQVPRAEVRMTDLAPTLYALLGLPAAADMPGRVLDDLFEVRPVPPVPTRVRKVAGAIPGAPSDHPRREQLEALGYIDAEGSPIPQPKRH